MLKSRNLIIIGTSHIAKQSIKEVSSIIEKESPDIIALELDQLRFNKLLSNKKEKFNIKNINLLNIIGAYIEKKLGDKVGVSPGAEMKTAINLAKKNNIELELIDQDIRITLKKLKRELTFKEKIKIVYDIIKSALFQSELKIDLTKVPEKKFINSLLKIVKKRYPSIYKVLVEERNAFMAKRLYSLMSTNKKILAVVGAGHEEGIINIIKCYSQKKKQKN